MANVHWIGGAAAVAQVWTASIDSVDGTPANNTFTLTVGDASVSVAGDTDVATTATALRAAANASTHPHMAAITWSGTSGDIIGTADEEGVAFVAELTETGVGTGAVTDFAVTTANAGPSSFATAANWSSGAVPQAGDDVTIAKDGDAILFDLDFSATALVSLTIRGSVKIGLNTAVFTDTVDEATTDDSAVEYRQSYLKVDADVIDIGQWLGSGAVIASQRTKIEQASTDASVITVYETAAGASEQSLPPCRIIAAHANCDLVVRNGLVGVAVENDETATIGEVHLIDVGGNSAAVIGAGTTISTYTQRRGSGVLQAAGTVATVTVDGGSVEVEGDFTITALNIRDGVVYDGHTKTSGNAITTLNITGGTIDAQRTREARTWATVNHDGGTILGNESLTMTTYNEPSTGDWQLVTG